MSTTTPFLDILPPEIRLRIYTSLLTSPVPIKGPWSRRFQQEKYNIHTAILRTNKQIHSEARHVFFGRNTFFINALPPPPLSQDDDEGEDLGSGAFEPPLQLNDLDLVRHLEVDLLYYPTRIPTQRRRERGDREMKCAGAERYITSLSYVLTASSKSLKSLKLVADARPHLTDLEKTLDMKKYLIGFHAVDQSARFKIALSGLAVANMGLRFDFSDMVFEFGWSRDVVKRASLVYLAGQVVLKRGEVGLKGLLEELGENKEHGGVDVGRVIVDWVC